MLIMKTIIKKFFNAKEAWIFLLIGLFLYYLGYYIIEKEIIKQIIIKFGDVLVIGVVLGYITNISALFGVFKKELEDVIYAEKFLKKRTDLEVIWENITKELFKSKFPSIHKDLLSVIKNKYLPVDNIIYYNDYNISIDIEWLDIEKKIIKCIKKIDFDLIAEDKCQITLPLQNWAMITQHKDIEPSICITNYMVNGEKPLDFKESVKSRPNDIEHTCSVNLSGSLKYEISQTIEAIYSIEDDFDICFKARYIINKLRVRMRHPNNIKTRFIERGTVNHFSENYRNHDSYEMKYKGLILPEQGFVIVLN